MTKFLFFDTETTGLPIDWKAPITNSTNWPRLVQVAWIITDDLGNILIESDNIIYPENFLIPEEATKVHGITNNFAVQNGVKLELVLKEFCNHLEDVDYVVAHNLNFDEKIIGAEFYRKKIKSTLFEKKRMCTMEISTNFCAIPSNYGYKWPTLAELHYKLFGETFQEAHNALIDIRITLKCFWQLVENSVISIHKKEIEQPRKTIIENKSNNNGVVNNEFSETKIKSENQRYFEIWSNLSRYWKVQINSQMPKITNPDYELPFDDPYLPQIPLEDTIDNEDASRLKLFFHSTTSFKTGSDIATLMPLTYFRNLNHLVIGEKSDGSENYGNKNISSLKHIKSLCTLKSLDCSGCPIEDLSPVKGLKNLKKLSVSNTKINSLESIEELTELEYIDLVGCNIRDISALSQLRMLTYIDLWFNPITDITPLKNLVNLKVLSLNRTKVFDFKPLSSLTKLKELNLCNTQLSDLTSLQNLLALEALYLSWTSISDLEPISNLKKIKYLWFHETGVSSLEPLINYKELIRLDFDKTHITNITPILNLPKLESISCVDCNLSSYQIESLKNKFPDASISDYKTKKQNGGCLGVVIILAIMIILVI